MPADARRPDRFCTFSGRSYTNPGSNLVVLAHIHQDDIIPLVEGRLGAIKLPEVMHEYTHHSCLRSPVGYALSLLHLMSQRAAWVMNERKDVVSTNTFAELVGRYYAAAIVLRPLFEGIALFAEFDVWPARRSDIVSRPMSLAMLFGTLFYPSELAVEILSMKLQMARTELVEKKADLFSSAFGSQEGGYLPGYALVRAMWREAVSRDEFFADPDAFLTYLMEVVFGSYSLVSLLLDLPKGSTELRVYDLAKGFAAAALARMREVFCSPALRKTREAAEKYKHGFRIDATVGQLARTASGGPSAEFVGQHFSDVSAFLFNEEPAIRKGTALIDDWMSRTERDIDAGPQEIRGALRSLHVGIINRRSYFWFGSWPVQWEYGDSGLKITAPGMALTVRPVAEEGVGGGRGSGSLELVFQHHPALLALVLVAAGRKMLVFSSGWLPDGNRPSLFAAIDQRMELELIDNLFSQHLDESVERIMPREAWQKALAAFAKATDDVLVTEAAAGLAKRSREFLGATAELGVFGALENDAKAVRLLAAASFLSTLSPPLDHFEDGISRLGYRFVDIKAVNDTFRQRFGSNLIQLSRDRVESSL